MPKIPGHNPESQILATRTRRRKRHDGPSLGDIPTAGANAAHCTTKNEILQQLSLVSAHSLENGIQIAHPLDAELAIAVIRRSLNRERHGADDQSPLDTKLVHDRATHEAS